MYARLTRSASKSEVGLGWTIAAWLAALMLLSAALVSGFARSAALVDRYERAEKRELVETYLQHAKERVVADQMVQLTWDDAFVAASQERDLAWADRYIGQFLWSTFGHDRLFLVRPDGALVRAWNEGTVADAASYRPLGREVARLLDQSSARGQVHGRVERVSPLADALWPYDASGQPLTRWAGALIEYRGAPALLTVASIVPDSRFGLLTRAPNYVATVQYLDPAFLRTMADTLRLDEVRFVPGGGQEPALDGVALTAADGRRLGTIAWRGDAPGRTIKAATAPLFVAFLLCVVALLVAGAAIVRAARRTARELAASEAQAQHLALHDPMTGLPNRSLFMQRLQARLEGLDPSGDEAVLVAHLDIDNFKNVNDTLGHHVGDELIRRAALRLRESLPDTDFIARLGGNEFVVMRQAPDGAAQAILLGAETMALFERPFRLLGQGLEVTASCGISWAPRQARDAQALLRNADVALSCAKQRGRARWRGFTAEMDAAARLRGAIELELRQAIADDQLTMAYQPIVDAETGTITGLEALVRWTHPTRGIIAPGVFVPIAEQTGQMLALGRWVLRRVFSEALAWPVRDLSINLSPIQVMSGGFVQELRAMVSDFRVEPARITFEITEGVLLDRSARVYAVLDELRAMGFRIALDDFGIGYSSLAYLRSFSFDRIKIDRSFVRNIENDLDAQAILRAVVALGRELRMKVVAEGVETPLQVQLVRAAGCQLIQGHFYSQALAPSEVVALLETPRSAPLRKVG